MEVVNASDLSLRRLEKFKPRGSRFKMGASHPAIREGRSLFPTRVFPASELPRVLISGHNSRKIGKEVRKGKWRSFPIFTLTLEERKTCPRPCREYARCYGNNMPFARRIVADEDFEISLVAELAEKQRLHPLGFVVRLHVLGDFYSADYVRLWAEALDVFPALHVFGYTAHPPGSDIGHLIHWLSVSRWDRFAFRFSGLDDTHKGAVVVDSAEETPHVVCPAQVDKTDCCGTCGLCWQSDRTIAFLRH